MSFEIDLVHCVAASNFTGDPEMVTGDWIEGTTVDVKKFGPVRTDYVLFVASGAFSDGGGEAGFSSLIGGDPPVASIWV